MEVSLRSTALATARHSLVLAVAAIAVACTRPSATTTTAVVPAGVAAVAVDDSANDQRSHVVADSLRARIIARADWSDAPDSCDPGVLRTFSADTSATQRMATEEEIRRLEEIIVGYGLDTPLDTRAGHELLHEVVAWEAGGGNLRWDAKAGEPDHHALAPGLGGRFTNQATKKCERYVQGDAVTVAIPALSHFVPPTVTGVRLRVLAGETELASARTAAGTQPFSYVHVGPVVLWRDYALVSTRRISQGAPSSRDAVPDVGNATYLMHRGRDGWRLLVIARTW
ncbi:MAG TPA: hypothetical protein VFJ74_10430 [Gemmatimonadaceae bacterium]|nr:hypothetical protein [Gemmatimonadaceae bacterium]